MARVRSHKLKFKKKYVHVIRADLELVEQAGYNLKEILQHLCLSASVSGMLGLKLCITSHDTRILNFYELKRAQIKVSQLGLAVIPAESGKYLCVPDHLRLQ